MPHPPTRRPYALVLHGVRYVRASTLLTVYGATDDPSEKWAEAWTAHLGSQQVDFQQHAPEQAAAVARVRQHLTRAT